MQCLPVLPTIPIHTPDRLNTGVEPTRQLHREIEPRPLQTQKHKDKETKTNKNTVRQTGLTDKHCSSATAKGKTPRGYLSTDSSYKIGLPPKCNQNTPKQQSQRTKGKNDKTNPKGETSKTGTTIQTKQRTGTKEGRRGQNRGLDWTLGDNTGAAKLGD